ncbi:MAG: hypothetical protein ACRDDY_03405 [Clostridium sp.]|uniref:hypothetical protein n=1 Tax=Clostridium sp. TaxID=1506 RepID=UPI003EE6852E
MSGKYRNNVVYMFTKPQPIFVNGTDLIKGVVVARRDFCNNKKVSAKDALIELKENALNLKKEFGVPASVVYKEPRKDFVWQERRWDYEEFCLSTLLKDEDNIYTQRVWFFELEEYVEVLD